LILSPEEEEPGGDGVAVVAEQTVEHLAMLVDSSIQVLLPSTNFDGGLVHPPASAGWRTVSSRGLVQLRGVRLEDC
jgi:hypothetical protein